jgi:hypothetical protein
MIKKTSHETQNNPLTNLLFCALFTLWEDICNIYAILRNVFLLDIRVCFQRFSFPWTGGDWSFQERKESD